MFKRRWFGWKTILVILSTTFFFIIPAMGYGLVSTQGNITMRNPSYNITLLPTLNVTSMSSDGTTLNTSLNSSSAAILLNTSADFTLSNLTQTSDSVPSDAINLTVSAISGTLNLLSKMINTNYIYNMFTDGASPVLKTSNSTGWVFFNFSTWSQHNLAIMSSSVPNITSWGNNITNNNSLTPRINQSVGIYFNATADQTITTWAWYINGVNQNNNQYYFNASWNTLGTRTIDLTATNEYGTSVNKTWTVTVSDITNPWLVNETVSFPSVAVNTSNRISANFTDDTNINTAIVRIQAPGATISDYAMICSASGNTSSCYYVTSDTPTTGTYTIPYYSVTDGSAHTVNISASNSFIVSNAPNPREWSNTLTQNSTLSAIRANISTSIGFSITTDATVQYYTWSKDGIVQGGENGQSFTTSWNTLGNKNVSVTATNPSGTSLATTWSVNITDITAPWLTSSSTDSINHYVQGYPVTISAAFADDTNISSAKVHVINPDLSEANWTMTCGVSGSTASCNLAYTTTMNVGVYQISSFYPVDGTSNQRNITPGLSFTTQPPLAGGSTGEGNREEEPDTTAGGGGSGKTGVTPQPTPPTTLNVSTEPDTKINFTDIREGATEPTAIDIASCLTDSLVMTNKCSSLNYGVVVEPFNWWVAIGAYLFSLGIIFIQTIRTDKPREWLKESIIYGTFTVILSAVLVSVGLNVYIVNYLIDSPKYFYTFLNFGIYGAFIAVIGDSYFYRKDKKTYKLKKKVSILEEF